MRRSSIFNIHMRRFQILFYLMVIFGAVFTGCQKDATVEGQPVELQKEQKAEYLQKSEQLAKELQDALGPRLMEAMQAGGPPNAIKVCQMVAEELTEKTSQNYPNIRISRTALRFRNPDNKPDELAYQVLKAWETQLESNLPLEPHLNFTENQVIIHRPIITSGLCLMCHGTQETINDQTREILNQLYPEDLATGFKNGDLRGAFRIEFER